MLWDWECGCGRDSLNQLFGGWLGVGKLIQAVGSGLPVAFELQIGDDGGSFGGGAKQRG